MGGEKQHTKVEGRVRESADGLKTRGKRSQQQLREARQRVAKEAAHQREQRNV